MSPDTQDRRRKLLWITPKAKLPCCACARPPSACRKGWSPLTPQEQAQLNALLTKLVFSTGTESHGR